MIDGDALLRRRMAGEKLSRRERADLDFWLRWRILEELQHVCSAMNARNVDEEEETRLAMGRLTFAEER